MLPSTPISIYTLSLGVSQAYLMDAPAGLVLVDTGIPHQEGAVMRLLDQLGRRDLKLIFLTHAHVDHVGSAAALKRLTGAPVAIHRLDAPALASGKMIARSRRAFLRLLMPLMQSLLRAEPLQADLLLEDGETLDSYGIPGVVVLTPGHTPGSCCLILENKAGFVGDLVSSDRKPHLQGSFADDWEQLRQSYARLRELKLERAYPGHGRDFISGEELQRLLESDREKIDLD